MSATRILYLCNWTGESGGIRVLYEHVRMLRQLGYDARLAAYGEFARCTWFANDPATTPAVSHLLDQLRPDDLVVLPEFCMWDRELRTAGCRQLVFVQNPDLMTGSADEPRYERLLVPSRPLIPWIRREKGYAGRIDLVVGCIESELVQRGARRRPVPWRPLRHLLVDRSDKNHGEPALVQQALLAAGREATLVDCRMPRAEFLQLFVEHDVYLHLSYREGFPLSILEAFAQGCLTVGFAGRGGLEFMRDGDNCHVLDDGDWRGVVARTLALGQPDGGRWQRMLASARATAADYPEWRMRGDLARLFAGLARRWDAAAEGASA